MLKAAAATSSFPARAPAAATRKRTISPPSIPLLLRRALKFLRDDMSANSTSCATAKRRLVHRLEPGRRTMRCQRNPSRGLVIAAGTVTTVTSSDITWVPAGWRVKGEETLLEPDTTARFQITVSGSAQIEVTDPFHL